MHTNLIEVFTRLDDSRGAIRAAVARIPIAARAVPPAPGRWSVDQIVEHLALVDMRFDAVVGQAIEAARRAGLGREQQPRVPLEEAVRTRLADRSERRDAPENMVPTGSLHGDAAVRAWERAHDAFRDTLAGADGLALGGVTAEHRRWGALTMYQWAEVMAAHEMRHAAQIAETAAARPAVPRGSTAS